MINCINIFESHIDSPLITIAIPTFKRGTLLVEAVDSALRQENHNIQYDIIVVDNNPERNDITEELMKRYIESPLVSYYKNEENIGPVGNWNRLYDLARGEYVVMLHDDDMLFPYYIRVVSSFLKQYKYKYKFVYPNYFFSKDRSMPHYIVPSTLRYKEITKEDYLANQWGLPSGMLISNKECHIMGGYKKDFWPINDQEFIYRALHIVKGANIRFPLCFYYRGVNASQSPQIIIDSIIQANLFNYHISMDKKNKLRWLARICKRNQIANSINWGRNFVTDDVIDEALEKINLKRNRCKDMASCCVANILKLYSYFFRMHTFNCV